ncbi:CLUMA_CG017274, isoform A [Clunio marinus]|uniref:CLUMA_CG017274, isoform A n=1 Tax=Clunio marinus TaxID=568069 RepID=A0A1J1IV73_9DIPT|nr:CLUMA_CG017274, isoform A [Clunio marinus]
MKLIAITLFALIAAVYSAPTQVSDNNVGDIITVGINAKLDIDSTINQDIVSIIVKIMNDQRIRVGGGGLPFDQSQITPEMIEQFRRLMA